LESPAGAEFAKGFEEAGAALGWDTTVFDGKFDPNGYQEGINRAIAAKADAVALYVVDCAAVQAPLRRAKKAGLLVVAGESADCDEAGEGEALFDGTSSWKQGDYNEAGRFGAEVQTSWVIKETKGAAKTILFHETDLQITRKQAEEAKRVLAKCQGCEIVQEVKFTAKDFGPALQQKAEQALLRNRDANSIIMPYDDVYLAGVGGAIRASGRKDDDLAVVSGIGQVPAIDAAREGQALDAGYGWVVEAQAYQLMDVLNRLSNDQEPAKESPFSVGLWDKSRLPPKGESWNPAIDYPAEYKRIWAEAGGQ
jgi:ribose transport system substrate-binding protein